MKSRKDPEGLRFAMDGTSKEVTDIHVVGRQAIPTKKETTAMAGTRVGSLAVLLMVLLLGAGRASAAQDEALKAPRLERTIEVQALEQVQRFADEVVRQHTTVMGHIAARIAGFIDTMTDVAATVTKATNTWIAHPTSATEAAVTQAVTTGAARGREAAETLAGIETEVRKVTQALREGLKTQLRDTQAAVLGAQAQAARAEALFRKAQGLTLDAKRFLEAQGYLAAGHIPAEWEEKLFRLAVDHDELAMLTGIWRDVVARLEEYVTVLTQADGDYAEIPRLVGMIAYQAASAGRVFGYVGVGESLKLRTKLVADAYAQAATIRGEVTSALSRMREVQVSLRQVVTATRRPSQAAQAVQTEAKRGDTSGLLAWYRRLGVTHTTEGTR